MRGARILAASLTTLLAAGLPTISAAPAHQASRAATPYAIFAGLSDSRVFRSIDGGQTWLETDAGLAGGGVFPLTAGAGATVYAAPGTSGVYISNDGGLHWQDDNGVGGPTNQAIFGLAVDPGDGERVYAIDGIGNFHRSQDSGGHWKSFPAPFRNFGGSTADAIVVDPLRPSTLLITAAIGMAISTDAGFTWNRVDSIPSGTDVYNAAFSGADPGVAYAATSDGIYQSIDGGHSWQPERLGIPTGTILVVVAVDPGNAATVVALSDQGLIFRSADGGTRWTHVSSTNDYQARSLAFDPAHPGTVLAGTTYGDALFISNDSGLTWRRTNPGFGDTEVVSLASAVRYALPTDTVPPPAAGTPGVYYARETHHRVSGAFLTFRTQYGGLDIFGLPLTEVFSEHGHLVQFFERAEMIQSNGQIHLAPLGTQLTAQRGFRPIVRTADTATHLYFPSTGHSLSSRFLTFWQTHNGTLLFGPPISEPLHEQNGDGTGRSYLVQYFQNMRMEYHPELAGTSNEVQVGQLGREALQLRGWL